MKLVISQTQTVDLCLSSVITISSYDENTNIINKNVNNCTNKKENMCVCVCVCVPTNTNLQWKGAGLIHWQTACSSLEPAQLSLV